MGRWVVESGGAFGRAPVDVEQPLEVSAELTAHGTVQQEVDGRVQQGQKIQKFAHSVKVDASVSGLLTKLSAEHFTEFTRCSSA